jgi:hypothetical protein
MQSNDVGQIAAALARAQKNMGNATKDAKNEHLRSKYATLASVREACQMPLANEEIAIVQLPATEGDKIAVTTMLIHSSGQWISCEMSAHLSANKALTEVQAVGSVITYLRRYTLAALVGIAVEDDDGNAAPKPAPRQEQRPAPRADMSDRDRSLIQAWVEWRKSCGVVVDVEGASRELRTLNAALEQKEKPPISSAQELASFLSNPKLQARALEVISERP